MWVTLWLWTEASYSEIVVPALGYVALVVLFAAIQMKTEPGWRRNLLITVLGLLLVGAQMRLQRHAPARVDALSRTARRRSSCR